MLADRRDTRLVDHIALLRAAMRGVKQRHPFWVEAMVVLPDLLHAIWTLSRGDAGFPTRWMLIKAGFSRRIPHVEYRSSSRLRKGECAVWQRRYWENLIRDQQGLIRHIDYIHYNPVKHGHALCAADWPYSSIHRYIRGGVISANCGGAKESHSAGFGERD